MYVLIQGLYVPNPGFSVIRLCVQLSPDTQLLTKHWPNLSLKWDPTQPVPPI